MQNCHGYIIINEHHIAICSQIERDWNRDWSEFNVNYIHNLLHLYCLSLHCMMLATAQLLTTHYTTHTIDPAGRTNDYDRTEVWCKSHLIRGRSVITFSLLSLMFDCWSVMRWEFARTHSHRPQSRSLSACAFAMWITLHNGHCWHSSTGRYIQSRAHHGCK